MMMIQGLNSCSTTTARTAEIMSRYRPIAPRPDNNQSEPGSDGAGSSSSNTAAVPQKINQSPYLRNVWHSLQARPTRTRKRGRTGFAPPMMAFKRQRATHHHHLFGFSTPTTPIQIAPSPPKNLTMQCLSHGFTSLLPRLPMPDLVTLSASCLEKPQDTIPTISTLVTLPLLRSPPAISPKQPETTAAAPEPPPTPLMSIDLNRVVVEIPEEKDLLQQLHKPISPNSPTTTTTTVISPQPIRLVGSSISVGTIKEEPGLASGSAAKTAEEVEEEVEAEPLPAVVSDSKNKVRLANPAYREMVGQPECSWLDSIMPCNRICGEVMLRFPDDVSMPISSSSQEGLGFSCWVTIQWLSNGISKSVRAFCDVKKLCCDSKDYLYTWRFHTSEAASKA